MKKNRSLLVVLFLLILVGFSIYVYKTKNKLSTVDEDARNFSFKDTAAITKIFIADKDGAQASVERTPKGWVVNNKFPCRSEAILNLLEVVKNVEVKNPVPKEAKENVIKFMSANAVKVEIYTGDELVKQYYVGHETDDSQGSYMLLTDVDSGKNFDSPFACFIPGFVGFLQPRFIARENEWRDRVVINYIPPQLKQIKVQHFDLPIDSSFVIDLQNTTTFNLSDLKGNAIPFDEGKMKQYLAYFQNISYEVLITGKNKKLQDSLSTQQAFSVITVTTNDLRKETFTFYRKPFIGDVNPELGIKYNYDPDRMYLKFAYDKEWALVQYFVFGKLLPTRHYFGASTK